MLICRMLNCRQLNCRQHVRELLTLSQVRACKCISRRFAMRVAMRVGGGGASVASSGEAGGVQEEGLRGAGFMQVSLRYSRCVGQSVGGGGVTVIRISGLVVVGGEDVRVR
jgi:hypothetical protein